MPKAREGYHSTLSLEGFMVFPFFLNFSASIYFRFEMGLDFSRFCDDFLLEKK